MNCILFLSCLFYLISIHSSLNLHSLASSPLIPHNLPPDFEIRTHQMMPFLTKFLLKSKQDSQMNHKLLQWMNQAEELKLNPIEILLEMSSNLFEDAIRNPYNHQSFLIYKVRQETGAEYGLPKEALAFEADRFFKALVDCENIVSDVPEHVEKNIIPLFFEKLMKITSGDYFMPHADFIINRFIQLSNQYHYYMDWINIRKHLNSNRISILRNDDGASGVRIHYPFLLSVNDAPMIVYDKLYKNGFGTAYYASDFERVRFTINIMHSIAPNAFKREVVILSKLGRFITLDAESNIIVQTFDYLFPLLNEYQLRERLTDFRLEFESFSGFTLDETLVDAHMVI